MKKFVLMLCVLVATQLLADPWGKDADLTFTPAPVSCACEKSSPLILLSEALIAFHQEVISPADGPRSNFIPSSSQYALEAIQKYGFFKGVSMGCDRLMRENEDPWIYRTIKKPNGDYTKWDPVP